MEIDTKSVRKKLKMTQEQFARAIGVSFPTVNRWETKNIQPSPLALAKIKLLLSEVE